MRPLPPAGVRGADPLHRPAGAARWISGRRRLAKLAAAAAALRGVVRRRHVPAADRAVGAALGPELRPGAVQALLERQPAHLEGCERNRDGKRRHVTLLQTPTTRPRTCTSRVRI